MSEKPKVQAGFRDAMVLGLSSSGPAQTVAVSLAGLIAAVGYGGPIVVLVAFLPMLGIALGYVCLLTGSLIVIVSVPLYAALQTTLQLTQLLLAEIGRAHV